MADLKLGSQIGGSLIWHQGILKLNPTESNLYFKDWDIITSKGGQSINGNLDVSSLVSGNGVVAAGTDNTWGTQPTKVAFSQKIDNTMSAHWLVASTKTTGAVRSGIQVLTNDVGSIRLYTNLMDNYTEFSGGQVSIQAAVPSAVGHATRKDYVDTQIQNTLNYVDSEILGVEGDITTLSNSSVKITGDQTVAGVKTFSSLPLVSVDPTTANQLSRKSYTDTKVAKSGDTMTGQLLVSVAAGTPGLKVGGTYKAMVGTSSIANEYIFGGADDGLNAFTSYLRVGATRATIRKGTGAEYDVITGEGGFNIAGAMTFGSSVIAAGIVQSNTGLWITNPNAPTASAYMSFINDIATIRYGGSGAGNANGFRIMGPSDVVKMMVDHNGEIYAGGSYKVYHTNNKPTAADVNALSLSGGTLTGNLTAPNFYGNLLPASTGSTKVGAGAGDGASATVTNLNVNSWYGVGFGPTISGQTIPLGENAVYINVRNGDLTARGTVTAPTFAGALSGNASSASVLATPRTLTIGDTGKSFNGSANVTWSLAEIGAADASHAHVQLNSRGSIAAEVGASGVAISGFSIQTGYNNGYPATFGNVLNMNTGGQGQIFVEWSGTSSSSVGVHGGVWVRSKRDVASTVWSGWARFYTTAYKPTADDVGAVSVAGDTMTGTLAFSNSGTTKRGISGVNGDSDSWFVGGGATAVNAGFLELATGDDGTEPVYVRQYAGAAGSGTVTRTLTLLDGSGNTTVPGSLTASSLTSSGQITASWSGDYAFSSQKSYGAAFYNAYSSSGTSEFHPLVKMRGTPSGGVHWTSTLGQLLSGTVIDNTCIHAISSAGTSWAWYFKHADGSFETPTIDVRQNGSVDFAANSAWGGFLRVGGNGFTVDRVDLNASVITTNGNLHLDSGLSRTTYINYYSGTGGVIFGNGASAKVASLDGGGLFNTIGEIQTTSSNGFRSVYGNYGIFTRNDGGNFYLMITNSGEQYGNWNTLRPFMISLGNGYVSMANGVSVGGGLTSTGNTTTSGVCTASRFATSAYDSGQPDSFSCGNWFRSTGNTGWFSVTHGGGIHMSDTVWVRTYGTKKFFVDNTASDAIYTLGGGNFNDVYIRSDIRLKSGLVKIDSALDKVKSLTGYTFDKKNTLNSTETTREMGIIADDLNKVAPEAVRIVGEDNLLTISPSAVNALLIEAIKEQQKHIDRLNSIVNTLYERFLK